MSKPLDVARTGRSPLEGAASFTLRNRLVRFLWMSVWGIFASWTPRQLHPWRRLLLRTFGARMGENSDVRGSARIWLPSNLEMGAHAVIGPNVNCYNQAPISVGARALISQGAYLCAGTHDFEDPNFQLVARPIKIGSYAWIAADAFVGPGVSIGDGVVLGARACAFRDLEPWTVCGGNPAKPIKPRKIRFN